MCTYLLMEAHMRIRNTEDIGNYLRDQRHEAGLTQTDLAARAGVSRRWLSDLEAGKPTTEVGLVLRVVGALGLIVDLRPAPHQDIDLDELLNNLGGAPRLGDDLVATIEEHGNGVARSLGDPAGG
jgi:HTH-type transcriptional regulator/antitoxin HipB